jgi:hypothetical protein
LSGFPQRNHRFRARQGLVPGRPCGGQSRAARHGPARHGLASDEAEARALLAARAVSGPPQPEAPPEPPAARPAARRRSLGASGKRLLEAAISKARVFLAGPVSFFGFALKTVAEGVGVEPQFGKTVWESDPGSGLGRGFDLPGKKGIRSRGCRKERTGGR